MGNPNYFNHEGYCDPTACDALINIENEVKAKEPYRPIVYICSPLAGETEHNIKKAREFCRFAVDSGYIPFAPHIFYTQFLDDDNPEHRKLGLFFGLVWLGKVSELWVFGEHLSHGMAMELEKAKTLKKIKIRYFSENFKECGEITHDTKC
jgi:hypothetical protein